MVVSYIHDVQSRDGDNDEGSISPLIVGMCALVLLIASVTLAVTVLTYNPQTRRPCGCASHFYRTNYRAWILEYFR